MWPRPVSWGAVTIATNMAGRGTDIMLGGNAEYLALHDLRKQDVPEELLAEANSLRRDGQSRDSGRPPPV